MLKYEQVENTPNHTAYKYYPEGKSEAGILVVDKASKEIIHMDLAPNDTLKWYALKLYARIKTWIDDDNLPQTGKIAWY